MADTLQELLASVGSFKQGAEVATKQILNLSSTQAELSAKSAEIATQRGEDASTVSSAAAAAALQTQARVAKTAADFSTDISAAGNEISKYAEISRKAQEEKTAALDVIAKKQSVDFFSDPLQYIVNQFSVQGDIAKHNAANAQQRNADERIKSINALTQTTAQTQVALAAPVTQASAEAAARAAAADSLLAANRAKQEGLAYNIQGINAALNASKETLQLQFSALNAKNAATQIQTSLEHLNLARQEFSFRQKEYEERRNDKLAQDQIGQSVVDTINIGRRALLGADAVPLDDVSGKQILATLKSKAPLSQQLQKFYDAGEASRLAGVNIIGTTPAKAVDTLQTVPSTQIPPVQQPVKNVLSTAVSAVSGALANPVLAAGGKSADPAFTGLDKKDRGSIERAVNVVAQRTLDAFAREVKPGDSSNPYQIPSVNMLAASSPTIQALPLYKKVLDPLVRSGVQLQDPKQLLSVVGEAVSAGKISHKEAIELTTIFQVGVKTNMAARNFVGYGLVPAMSYNASVETAPNAFHSSEIVDLTKPDAVSRAIVKMQTNKLTQGSGLLSPITNIAASPAQAVTQAIFGAPGVDTLYPPTQVAPGIPKITPAAAAVESNVSQTIQGIDAMFAPGTTPAQRQASGKITPQK